jgi:hypothetical protein
VSSPYPLIASATLCWLGSGPKATHTLTKKSRSGVFVRRPEHYPWLQTFMTRSRLQELMGEDWRDDFFIERMEFPNIVAVHFVIYGPLGRGVSSCRLLDALGKGFADYIRDKVVDVPERFLSEAAEVKKERRAML